VQESQRHLVLSRDTFIVLELDFSSSPGHPLAFDALEIPFARFFNHTIDRKGRRLLTLQILLVDASTGVYVRPGEYQEGEDEWLSAPSLVEFQAEHNIVDLYDGKAVVRFKPPCCFLDSMHHIVNYRYESPISLLHEYWATLIGNRICIALQLYGIQVAFHTLPGIFEVVHNDQKIPESDARHLGGTVKCLPFYELIMALTRKQKPIVNRALISRLSVTSARLAIAAENIALIAILIA
jgi:hypothetical protein